ncbi:MAG: hypothetical protein NTX25_04115 [Proteobacteria bacterium]|nr:hypothetical protein [Pseudomonadota bacterium]
MNSILWNWRVSLCLCLSLSLGRVGYSQTFEEGYQSYMRNQFPVAELQFRNALKKAKTKEDRAFILKFAGICQYMRGDKKAAATTFYEAIIADKNVAIDEEEVLDPSVVSFFNTIKSKHHAQAESNSPTKAPANQSPTVKATTPEPTLASKATSPSPAAQAQTPAQAQAPINAPPPRSKRKKKASGDGLGKAEDDSRNISWVHFLPFGAGQFYNNSPILGSGFAGLELYLLYNYSSLTKKINEERSQNNQVNADPGISSDAKNDFIVKNLEFISSLNDEKQISGVAFFSLWIGGAAEALINAPRARPSDEHEPEDSSHNITKTSFQTAWLPNKKGGTYLLQLHYDFD